MTMTFVPVDFDSAVEAQPAPAGSYQLQIVKADVVETGANSTNPGRPQYKISIGFPENANVPNLTQYISLPHADDEPDKAQFKALLLKRFLTLFNVPFQNNGFDLEQLAMDMVGATATGAVSLTAPDDNGNVYNRLNPPRIKGEGAEGRGRPPQR